MPVDPEKQKRQKILTVSLLLILSLLVVWNVKRQARRSDQRPAGQTRIQNQVSPPTVQPTLPEAPSFTKTSGKETLPPELLERKKALVWRRDPFLLGISEGEIPTLQLKVSGIIYDVMRPEATYAIINDEVYRIGDSIHGIKVIDIQPDFVRLKKFDQDVYLYLYEEEE